MFPDLPFKLCAITGAILAMPSSTIGSASSQPGSDKRLRSRSANRARLKNQDSYSRLIGRTADDQRMTIKKFKIK